MAAFVRAGAALRRGFHSTALRAAEDAAAAGKNTELLLNFATPVRPLVNKKAVRLVTLPGRDGVFGVEKNSPPILSELRPGVVTVEFTDGAKEEYFVPGGFTFKHANNVLDVSSTEGFKLDQFDAEAIRALNNEATKKRDNAAPGSAELAEAKIQLELYKSLSTALKVQL